VLLAYREGVGARVRVTVRVIRVGVRSAQRLTALLERVAVLADQLEEANHKEELVEGAGSGSG